MQVLIDLILHLGWIAVAAVIFAESGLLIGFFLPGDSLLFTAGFLVQQGILPINIHVFAVILFLAAVLGDSVGYTFGKRVGRKLFERESSRLFRKQNLIRAEAFYKKYGAKTIVIARFVPIVRTFAPIVAGASDMPYKTFLLFNIIGAFLWTMLFTYLGYFAGKLLIEAGVNIEVTAIIIVLISIAPFIFHAVKDANRRKSLIEATKRELKIVFSKNKKSK